jgi:hypothetical protein
MTGGVAGGTTDPYCNDPEQDAGDDPLACWLCSKLTWLCGAQTVGR